MLDIVHRLYENYDESYCKEKYLKSKSELLEMINSAMSDTDLKEELLCDTYSFNNCISVYRKVWEKKYSEKEIITKCSETIRIVNYYNSILISLKTFWQKCNCNIDEVNIHQQAISMRMYLFEVISAIQIIQQDLQDYEDENLWNYPILYSGDNQKYLRTDLHGNSHIAGCIFLEGLNKSDFSDYYNIIYGHNMNDGSMFGSLKKYKDDGFWKENQYFTVYSETTAYRYRIFSYEDAVNGGDVYKVGYQPGEEYQKFIDQMIKDSDVDTGVKPQTSNKILTLSTCTGNGYSKRLAIHAVCIDAQTTDESKLKETGN